jgi:hypothetical protein
MAFTKTSIAFRPPKRVEAAPPPEVGEERDGKVWDGDGWVTKAEWEARETPKE